MTRSKLFWLFTPCASLLLGCWPLTASAHPAGTSLVTTDDVTAEFMELGFQVSSPIQWGVASTWSRVTAVSVSDPADPGRRNAMILIFPSVASAELNREVAAQQDQVESDGGVINVRGPRLIGGYGYSMWFENVAIVQENSNACVDPDFAAIIGTS